MWRSHRPESGPSNPLRAVRRLQQAGQLLGVAKGGDVADLGDESDGGQRVDAAQAAKAGNRRRPPCADRLLKQDLVEAVAAREQHRVTGHVLAEDDLDKLVVKANLAQPLQMPRRPRLARDRA
jgi:hypothetical protein